MVADLSIRSCEVMQYFKFYDVQEIAVIESRIKSLTNVKDYCIIIHDKDKLESWEMKGKHFHSVITFSSPTKISVVARCLKVEPQFVNKIKASITSAKLYLVHKNDDTKYQYKPEEVIANFDYVSFANGYSPRVKKEEIAVKIDKWEIKEYNLCDYISIDEYSRNKLYYDRCFQYRQRSLANNNRQMECIYISGDSGVGKTTFAKMFAEWKWFHCYISSGWKNPIDDYKWQECIILDDFRDDNTSVGFSDFLKLTDNHTSSMVGCRFINKSISECKLLIITSVQPIDKFYAWNCDSIENQSQIYRRLSSYMVMDKDYITEYVYNESKKEYVLKSRCNNIVSDTFTKDKVEGMLSGIADALGLKMFDNDIDLSDASQKFIENVNSYKNKDI